VPTPIKPSTRLVGRGSHAKRWPSRENGHAKKRTVSATSAAVATIHAIESATVKMRATRTLMWSDSRSPSHATNVAPKPVDPA